MVNGADVHADTDWRENAVSVIFQIGAMVILPMSPYFISTHLMVEHWYGRKENGGIMPQPLFLAMNHFVYDRAYVLMVGPTNIN